MNKGHVWFGGSPHRSLVLLLLLGLVLRVLFWQFGATHFYGPDPGAMYSNGDTASYVNSFLNLWHHGVYTFNAQEPEAAFGRLPGYPFFVGLHYLIVGPEHFQQAVAVSQILLDTAAIGLCYQLTLLILPRQPAGPALLAALLYATYPFAIVWVTVTGTETLGIFLVLLWAVVLLRGITTARTAIILGVVVAAALFVREYLGILLPITALYLLLKPTPKSSSSWLTRCRLTAWLLLGFLLIYGWWPARNIASQHRLVLLKPVSAGYSDMRPDMLAFLDWVHLWSNDNTYWLQEVLAGRPASSFPAHVVPTLADQHLLQQLIRQANTCGSSFYFRRHFHHDLVTNNCNEQLRLGFEVLQHQYQQSHPWRARLEVPLLNLRKAFFKTQLVAGNRASRLLVTGLFAWRSALLLLGLWGSYRLRRYYKVWPLLGFSFFMYVFICIFFHSLEMRYLLQADVLLLLPAAAMLWSGPQQARQALTRVGT